jgi:ribonuclease-3
MNNYEQLENLINYKFKDKNILNNALTHISFANENNCDSYERLEFLGDAIIEMVVSEYIYHNLFVDAGTLT